MLIQKVIRSMTQKPVYDHSKPWVLWCVALLPISNKEENFMENNWNCLTYLLVQQNRYSQPTFWSFRLTIIILSYFRRKLSNWVSGSWGTIQVNKLNGVWLAEKYLGVWDTFFYLVHSSTSARETGVHFRVCSG